MNEDELRDDNTIRRGELAPEDAAAAHHLIDALAALEHLSVDLAKDGSRTSTKKRCALAQVEVQKALALIRDEK